MLYPQRLGQCSAGGKTSFSYAKDSFWALYFIPLMYAPFLMPVLYCSDYYSFAARLEIWDGDTSGFTLLSQDSFGGWVFGGSTQTLGSFLLFLSEMPSEF